MEWDISSIVSFTHLKNGRVKIKFDDGNLFVWLRELGYRKAKINNRLQHYKRDGNELRHLHKSEIRAVFSEMLKKFAFTNIPDTVQYLDIINAYYEQRPIRENGLYDHYLADIVTADEAHNYMLKTDEGYKHKFEAQSLVSQLEEWGFVKSVDYIGSYHKGDTLYYKQIEKEKYLVFHHLSYNGKDSGIFDCTLSIYANAKYVGNKKPPSDIVIMCGFKLQRDWHLIEQYLSRA